MRRVTFWVLLVALVSTVVASPGPKTARVRLADGFDYPVGPPNAEGYYMSRGFRPNGHLGEDWNGLGGGNTDLGRPIYNVGNGMVVFAKDVRLGWGNVVIIRHAYVENGELKNVDSLYGHLDRILVREGQVVRKGEQIGTMGNNRGMYLAHLHFEMRKNLYIGINRSAFKRDFSNYFSPTQFINARRNLPGTGRSGLIALNTFSDPRTFDAPTDESKFRTGVASRSSSSSSSKAKSGSPTKRGFKIDRYGEISSF